VSAAATKVPEEAERHMARATAALDVAKDQDGYTKAIAEFEATAAAAPDWPDPFYNLGMVYSKVENYEAAIKNYRRYLELAPRAQDAKTVKSEIYKLEFKLEEQEKARRYYGFWFRNIGEWMMGDDDLFFDEKGARPSYITTVPKRAESFIVKFIDGKMISQEGDEVEASITSEDNLSITVPTTEGKKTFVFTRGCFIGIKLLYTKNWFAGFDPSNEIEILLRDGPGEKAGLKTGDHIISINGEKYKPTWNVDFSMKINGFPKDSIITLAIKRDGEDIKEYAFKRP